MTVQKGDLIQYEYLTRHPSGVGWEFHKGVGLIVGFGGDPKGSYVIMTEKGNLIERLDIQIESIDKGEKRNER